MSFEEVKNKTLLEYEVFLNKLKGQVVETENAIERVKRAKTKEEFAEVIFENMEMFIKEKS